MGLKGRPFCARVPGVIEKIKMRQEAAGNNTNFINDIFIRSTNFMQIPSSGKC